jgi:pimeloyl-ACP methyl ester carboxylesterase
VTVVQGTLHVKILQAIITQLRTGSLLNVTTPYKKVILATHSYGSILGRSLATVHPNDGADAYVLTGASNDLTGFADALKTFQIESASITYPHHTNLAPGYASISSEGIRLTTYSRNGDFSPSLLAYDQKQDHIFAIGEIAAQIPNTVSNFTGPVMVETGKQDQIICGVGNIAAKVGDCGIGKESNPYGEKMLFPRVKNFGLYIPDHTGHNANLHYSSGEVFGAAHEWLESVGF